jgi:DNA repair photolyase
METLIHPDTIFVNTKSIGSELFNHITAAHPSAEVVSIKHNTESYNNKYGLSDHRPSEHFREKKTKAALLHREAKWKPDPNGNSTDFLPGLMISQGCGFGCTYCYTERHFPNNFLKLYDDAFNVVEMIKQTVNNEQAWREKMLAVAKKDFEKHRDNNHCDNITFDLGCDSDCVLDNQLTSHAGYSGHIIDIMNQVSLIPGVKTSFATKSSQFNRFLSDIKRPSHHRIRLSLMPEHHKKTLEINTATITSRLVAVNALVEKGFEVHINLSPIIVTSDFIDEYTDLLQLVDNSLSQKAKDQLAYEIIFLTHATSQFECVSNYAPKAHKMMVEGPLPIVPKPNKPNVLSYSTKDKVHLKQTIKGLISNITPYGRIRYCY